MISHALTIVVNELNKHLTDSYGSATQQAALGNLSEGLVSGAGGTGIVRDMFYLCVVNVKEEKTLKNIPNYVRNDVTLKATYENPPVFLNFLILMAATHSDYTNALLVLSRAIRFFQMKNVFTQDSVAPESITKQSPVNVLDRLQEFKLIFDIYSPSLEEVNHLWGTLGGKQYPFVLYVMRMLDLKFEAVQAENSLILEVVRNLRHKDPNRIGP